YAMWARRYMHEFSVTHADLAEVAVFTRYHATLNPDSVMGRKGEITVEDVLASRYVCEPLHLLDCSIDNDGGYAVVIASAERARDCRQKPVWILGGSMPANTDGGLLSNSHCGDPSGMHTIEVVRQLRGECGARQVPGARIGVSLQQGWAVHGMASTLVMAAD